MFKAKKTAAVFCAAFLAFSASAPVRAEEAETDITEAEFTEETEISLSEVESAYDGTWVEFEAGFQLYLPSDWDILELTEEDEEDGILFWSQEPDADEDGQCLYLGYIPADEDTEDLTLDDLEDSFSDDAETYASVKQLLLNGIEVLAYEYADGTACGMMFMDGNGGFYYINCSLPEEEADREATRYMMISLSPLEEEETETETE